MQRDDITLHYIPDFLDQTQANQLYETLLQDIHWQSGSIYLFGKERQIPRLQAFYADTGIAYRYSGKTLHGQELPEVLDKLRIAVEQQTSQPLNAVLCNLYRNGDDHMGWHSDDEKSLGKNPLIASLSFGAGRDFLLRNKINGEKLQLRLQHGSLLIMAGECQHNWQHALPKRCHVNTPRINLTFRYILT